MRIIACILFTTSSAFAQTTVDFQVDDARAQQVGVDPTEIEQGISSYVEDALRIVDADAFMASMSEATAIAGKGLGVDYASNPQQFVFGISIGTGANASGLVLDRDDGTLPEGGFAAQTSAMAGLNLGLLDGSSDDEGLQFLDRFVVSVHGMSFRAPGNSRTFQGSMYNYGGHVTMKLIGHGEKGILDWGGLALTTGYEHATYRLRFTGDAPFSTDADDVNVRWNATGVYDLVSDVESIPFELSSNVRVSVVTVFLGAGVDLNVGRTTGVGALSGPIIVEVDSGAESIGTGEVASDATGDSEPLAVRGFGGVQVNILPVKLYAAIHGSSRASASLQAGLRIAM